MILRIYNTLYYKKLYGQPVLILYLVRSPFVLLPRRPKLRFINARFDDCYYDLSNFFSTMSHFLPCHLSNYAILQTLNQ